MFRLFKYSKSSEVLYILIYWTNTKCFDPDKYWYIVYNKAIWFQKDYNWTFSQRVLYLKILEKSILKKNEYTQSSNTVLVCFKKRKLIVRFNLKHLGKNRGFEICFICNFFSKKYFSKLYTVMKISTGKLQSQKFILWANEWFVSYCSMLFLGLYFFIIKSANISFQKCLIMIFLSSIGALTAVVLPPLLYYLL